jgi:hypothetical protein
MYTDNLGDVCDKKSAYLYGAIAQVYHQQPETA